MCGDGGGVQGVASVVCILISMRSNLVYLSLISLAIEALGAINSVKALTSAFI